MNSSQATRDDFSRDVLEFSSVVDLLRPFLSGALSQPVLAEIGPDTNVDEISRDIELIRDAQKGLTLGVRPSLAGLADPRPPLEKLRVEGVCCSATEIFQVVEVARTAQSLREKFRNTPLMALHALAQRIADLRTLLRELDGKILPDGSLDSSASSALAAIRRAIEAARHDLETTLDKLVHRLASAQMLQDDLVAVRNGRYVLPVRAEKKRAVQGIVHGTSSTGASVFIEPLETLPLNNELAELEDREAAEIRRLLAEFSARLRANRQELLDATTVLARLDLAFAKAEFARRYEGCIPEFSERELLLTEARHPLLEKLLQTSGSRPVPLSIDVLQPRKLLIVSGPNAGGKTVALKTIGVAALMAQSALPVLAREARLPLFTRVLADIGDQQSLEQNLSTFSGHVRNIQRMAQVASEDDLLLLDELGGSTDPQEGAALALAELEHFRRRKCWVIATTHQSRLKNYAFETNEAVNAAMDFDEINLRPTYRLVMGLPGKSSGLDVAMRLGLDHEIVEHARSLLAPEEVEASSLAKSLRSLKEDLEADRARLRQSEERWETEIRATREKTAADREAKLKELDRRLEQVLRDYDRKWKQAIEAIRLQSQKDAAQRKTIQAARKGERLQAEARQEWNIQVLESANEPSAPDESLAPPLPRLGDRVKVKDFPTPGIVTRIMENGQMDVEVGQLHMRVCQGDIRLVMRSAPKSATAESGISGSERSPAAPAKSETAAKAVTTSAPRFSWTPETTSNHREGAFLSRLNVIGETAEEAREQVDRFLDDAYLAGSYRVVIVHGHGKGVLKKALHEMLSSHPHVEKFYSATPQEGGSGATVAELKA